MYIVDLIVFGGFNKLKFFGIGIHTYIPMYISYRSSADSLGMYWCKHCARFAYALCCCRAYICVLLYTHAPVCLNLLSSLQKLRHPYRTLHSSCQVIKCNTALLRHIACDRSVSLQLPTYAPLSKRVRWSSAKTPNLVDDRGNSFAYFHYRCLLYLRIIYLFHSWAILVSNDSYELLLAVIFATQTSKIRSIDMQKLVLRLRV